MQRGNVHLGRGRRIARRAATGVGAAAAIGLFAWAQGAQAAPSDATCSPASSGTSPAGIEHCSGTGLGVRYAGTSTSGTGATADTLVYLDQININTISGLPGFGVQLNDVSKPNGATYISGGYKLTVSDATSSAAGSIVSTLANSPGVSIASGGNNVAFDSSMGTTVTNVSQKTGQGIVLSTSGTGTITVTTGGAVTAAAEAIDTWTTGSGRTSITTNAPVSSGNIIAINAQSGTGDIALTTNAAVMGNPAVYLSTGGSGAITYQANANVTGAYGAIQQTTVDGANALVISSSGTTIDGGSAGPPAVSLVSTGTGDVTVTAAAGTQVKSSGGAGIAAYAEGGVHGSATVTVAGTIATYGSAISAETNTDGLVTVSIDSSGVLSASGLAPVIDAESVTSVNSHTTNAAPSGAVTVNLSGAITSSASFGIKAVSAGSGAIAVNTAAGSTITGTSSSAIFTQSWGSGAITIATASGSQIGSGGWHGIEAVAYGSGTIAIRANGNAAVTANGADAIRASASGGPITIATTAAVTTSAAGAAVEIINTDNAAANVLNNDTTLLGAGSQSGSAFSDWEPAVKVATASGATTINNDAAAAGTGVIGSDISALAIAASGGAITINNAGTLNGRVDFSNLTGQAVLNNTSATSWHVTGASTFSPQDDTLNNAATGVITMAGTTTVDFLAGNDTLTNAGRINAGDSASAVSTFDFGDGTDSATNSGTIAVQGSAVLAHLETFSNSGTLDLQADGALTDTMKMAGTAFEGSGASTLKIDAALGNQTQTACATPAVADCLVIGTASGSTVVNVHDTLAGSPGYYNPTGILVVDGTGGSPSAFVLAGSNVTTDPAEPDNGAYIQKDFYDYYLKPNANTGDWMLIGAPGRALYQIGKIGAGLQTAWDETAKDVTDRTVELRDTLMGRSGQSDEVGRFSIWVHGGYGRFTRASTDTYDLSTGGSLSYIDGYGQTLSDAIAGIDFTRSAGDGVLALGAFGGYGTSNMDFKSSTTRVRLSGENAGAYVTYMHRALFASLVGKADRSRVHLEAPSVPFDREFNATTYGGIFEFGAHVVENDFFFEPLGSVSYSTSTLDGLSGYATTLAFKNTSSIKGRFGLRFGASLDTGDAGLAQPYLSIASVEEFAGRNGLTIASGTESLDITDHPPGASGELGAGVDFVEGGGLSGYLRGETIFNDITVNGFTVRAGLRWVF